MNDQDYNRRLQEYKAIHGSHALEHFVGPGGDVVIKSIDAVSASFLVVDSGESITMDRESFDKQFIWLPYDEMPFYMANTPDQLAALTASHNRIVQAQLLCMGT